MPFGNHIIEFQPKIYGRGKSMAEEKDVRIVAWPEKPAVLEHRFDPQEPCPVSISFEDKPAQVVLHTDPKQNLNVNMNMNVKADKPLPVCLSVCEPLCLDSDYTIGISIFDNPVSTIRLRGRSRLSSCDEQIKAERTCVNLDSGDIKPGIEIPQPITYETLTFIPLGDFIRTSTIGDPADQVKLAFPREGVRVEFLEPASDVSLMVNNYSGSTLDFLVYVNGTLSNQFRETIQNAVKAISLNEQGVTAVEIKGGDNEASIIEVCYTA